ncbi:MAG: permease [Gammaproteobacteria bacterium]|nr:permease [Gammaproteobacteria bacterium]
MKDSSVKRHKSGIAGWIFLGIVLSIYALTAVLDGELAATVITTFSHLLERVLPVLLIVFLLIFVINLLLNPAWIKKYLGHRSGITGWLVAIAGGVLSTGPVYPWYALLSELRERGMKMSLAAVFLYSRAVKLPLIPMLIHYFGLSYTLVLLAYLLIFSIFSGLAMERLQGSNPGIQQP